ncbi:hypothetical protein ACQ86N_47985 [Puia sp. P3]|uniref:gliding motility protein GldB-related protein n=1 Tax=Puia sp. P3 TaxID=3423952 RepID=UPI003D66E8F3
MKYLALIALVFAFAACGNRNGRPDVGSVPVGDVRIERFDTAFFSLDSNNIVPGLYRLNQKYPWFTADFVGNILGAGPLSDTSRMAFAAARQFLTTYYPVRDSIEARYRDLGWLEKELKQGFKYVKYYFPQYRLPEKEVAFIGPFDGPGIALTSHALAIGLQSYAGRNFSYYISQQGQDMYPQYISRKFEPEYITANCLRNLSEDVCPDSSDGRPMIEQMIVKGRYWWLGGKLQPDAPDSIVTGYSQAQLRWCASMRRLSGVIFYRTTSILPIPISSRTISERIRRRWVCRTDRRGISGPGSGGRS